MSETLLRKTGLWKELEKEIAAGLSHAYFILTPDTTAVTELFYLFAKRVICKRGGCGYCAECEQIAADSHPDVKFYQNASKLTVKDAEELIEDTQRKSLQGGKKLYFLQNADGMSPAVQNKLLKTYEEPPAEVVIVLQAAAETAMLPTIRSRAKKMYLGAFTAEQLTEELSEMEFDRKTAETAGLTAAGSLTDALRFASDEGFLQRYDDVFELLLQLKKSSGIPAYIGAELFQKDNILMTLDFIERIVWDSVKSVRGAGKPQRRTIDYQEIGKGVSAQAAAQISGLVNEARKKISLNLSVGTVAERLLFGILEAKFQWQI